MLSLEILSTGKKDSKSVILFRAFYRFDISCELSMDKLQQNASLYMFLIELSFEDRTSAQLFKNML